MMYSAFNIKRLETYGFAEADLLINPCNLSRRSFSEGGSVSNFLVPQCLCGYESIMQNKPNFKDDKMNTTFLLTKDYE